MSRTHSIHSDMPRYSKDELSSNIILNLRNFRTYNDDEIKIPKNSTTLIVGPSGIGKTSILEAFIFILYDGIQTPEKFNTKRCWGWLHMDDMVFYRQKDPKLLKVWKGNNEYVKSDAQDLINDIFGDQLVFFATSYLRQKEFSPFLHGKDSEKMDIVKRVAFKDIESDAIKEPIKEKVDQLSNQCIGAEAQLQMAISNINSFDARHPKIIQENVPENSEDVMKAVTERRILMDQLDKKFELVVREEMSLEFYKQQLKICESNLNVLNSKIKEIDVEVTKSKLKEIESELEGFSDISLDVEKLAKAQMFKHWKTEHDRLTSNLAKVTKDKNELKTSIEKIWGDKSLDDDKFISETISKISDINKSRGEVILLLGEIEVQSIDEAKTKLKSLETEIEDLKEKEEHVRSQLHKLRLQNAMECPECSASLVLTEDGKSLESKPKPVTKTVSSGGIGGMLEQANVIKSEVVEEEITVTHDDLNNALTKRLRSVNLKERIESVISKCESKLDFKLKIDVDVAVKSLSELKKYLDIILAIKSLTESIETHESKRPEEITDVSEPDDSKKKSLEAEKEKLKSNLTQCKDIERQISLMQSNFDNFSKQIEDHKSSDDMSSEQIKSSKISLQEQIDQLMHLSSASDLIAQRTVLENDMKNKSNVAKTTRETFEATKRLHTRAIEAERIFLQTAVSKINVLLGRNLQKLFPDTPISVELSTTKKLKSKKGVSQRFDVRIFYRDSQYSSSRQLSGGEKDRVSLAITLAMNETFGSPFLFLDETLASLDSDLKSEAVALLREMSERKIGGKVCVVIAHEETEGLYNNVLRL